MTPTLCPTMTAQDILQRESFVTQYMVDFDAHQAALRLNYGEKSAAAAAAWFMADSYVLNRIEQEQKKLGISTEEDIHRHRIVTGLYRIANNGRTPASAKVAAWAQLSKILGVEKIVKPPQEPDTNQEFIFKVVRAFDGRKVE